MSGSPVIVLCHVVPALEGILYTLVHHYIQSTSFFCEASLVILGDEEQISWVKLALDKSHNCNYSLQWKFSTMKCNPWGWELEILKPPLEVSGRVLGFLKKDQGSILFSLCVCVCKFTYPKEKQGKELEKLKSDINCDRLGLRGVLWMLISWLVKYVCVFPSSFIFFYSASLPSVVYNFAPLFYIVASLQFNWRGKATCIWDAIRAAY